MFEDFFIIPQNKIDENWKPIDLSYDFFALEYCENVLDIPIYFIEDVNYTDSGLEISLKSFEKELIILEDWYIQLLRLSIYTKVS